MKLTFFLLLFSLLTATAGSIYSQSARINLKMKDASLVDVFREIERKSEFGFFFKSEDMDLNKHISIDMQNATISEIMEKVLISNYTYRIIDKNIIITKANITEIQQQKSINGRVTDSSGGTLPGVSVVIKGTTNGTITDMDGNYKISNVPENATLVFSFVGMKTQEVAVGNKVTINITLTEETVGIEEVVAIGYGNMKKSDLAGSTGSVKSDVLEQRPVSSFNQTLSGKISGVNVSTNSGRPGGHAMVRIRGNSSISVTNDPLYVVDGVILNVSTLSNGTSPIDYLNPNDVKSVEVLKDASATAIYGARGSNGVILITTKREQGKGAIVQYSADFGIGVLPKKLDVLNAKEFIQLEDLAYTNAQKYDPEGWSAGAYTNPKIKRTNPKLFDSNGNPLYDTNWQDETIQNAYSQTHQLLVTNSKDGDSYGFSLGYRDDDGLILNSGLKRYSGRFFMDNQIRKWFKIGGSLSYLDQKERQTDSMGDGGITVGRQMVEALPILPVRYEDGTFAGNADYPGMEGGNNPVQVATDRNLVLETQSVLGNVYSNITLAKGLEFRSVLGVNIINQKTKYYGGKQLIWISAPNGDASISNNRNNSWQFENYLTYNKKISEIHSITAMVGTSLQHVDNAYSSSSNSGFEDDFFLYNNLGVGTSPSVSSYINAYGLNSYFARGNYSYKNKYLVTATARLDGSSKFGKSNKYAFFPSFALAWRLSEEKILKDISVISNLKLRASYGVTGNSETGAYASRGGLGNYSVVFGNSKASGIGISRLANPDLQWEKTKQSNVGLDLGFFDNRISIEADFYYKKTNDMLLGAPVPASSGYTSITKNIGSMKNEGFEITLNTVNIDKKNFRWETTFNLSFNKNEVLSLGVGNDDIFPGPDILSASNNIIRVGEPVGSFYGYKRLGTWGTNEAGEAKKYGLLPGDLKLWDKNNDYMINDADKLIIGKGIPDGYGTLSNNIQYKNFEFLIEFQYMFGNDVLDISKHSAEDRTGIANSYKTVLNAWTPENQNTMIAQIRPVGAGYTTNIDSHFVENGSFIRGRNVLLAYNFPHDILSKLSLRNLKVYGSIQNFLLTTKYKGFDPEVSDATQSFAQGITVFGYPKPRTFTIGLNVSF
jgi:TonB-linked SusC/RagA family outer membrane protein